MPYTPAMRASNLLIPILILLWIASAGCWSDPQKEPAQSMPDTPVDSLAAYLEYANQALNEHEEEKIGQFLRRHEWDLQKTSTGLRYTIYRKGEGANAEPGNSIVVNYTLTTLNGIVIASSTADGPMNVTIERSDVINGLHELLQFMNTGAKAKAIIPARLGYGFTGDQERIPKGATLIYDVEVVSIKNNNNH